MIAELVPSTVRVCESADPSTWRESTLASERAAVARAVPKRRLEHGAVRELARAALRDLGLAPIEILSGAQREPLWAEGVVGSLTHCAGYCAAAVALSRDVLTLGIDAEPATPLDDSLTNVVCSAAEQDRLRRLEREAPDVPWTKVAFSVKEAIYKAWFPVTRRWLGFEDVDLVCERSGRFRARLLVDGPLALTTIAGQFAVWDGLVQSAAVVERRRA